MLPINKKFSRQRRLKLRVLIIINRDVSNCLLCGKSFSTICYLRTHMKKMHTMRKNFKCETCGKSVSSKSNLKKHINDVHEKMNKQKCCLCEKLFFRKPNLQRHMNLIHDYENQKHYKCNSCDKTCSTNGNLKKFKKSQMLSMYEIFLCEKSS